VAESKQKRTELLTEIRKPAQRESETFKADALKQLKKLKAGYIKVYLGLYAKARLNLTQDKEKKDLLQGLPAKASAPARHGQFHQFRPAYRVRQPAWQAPHRHGSHRKDLENDPKSPDGFWPAWKTPAYLAKRGSPI
jgi:hypothetical protein